MCRIPMSAVKAKGFGSGPKCSHTTIDTDAHNKCFSNQPLLKTWDCTVFLCTIQFFSLEMGNGDATNQKGNHQITLRNKSFRMNVHDMAGGYLWLSVLCLLVCDFVCGCGLLFSLFLFSECVAMNMANGTELLV